MTEQWGPFVWKLFHTLAYKIKPEHFNTYKDELIYQIIQIATYLPCPYCSTHSKLFFQKHKRVINKITTKSELIQLLYNFHNDVNKRLTKNIFPMESLKQYHTENTIQVINLFINRYSISSRNTNLFHLALASKDILSKFMNWIQNNIHIFDK